MAYVDEVLADAPWGFWSGTPSGTTLSDASGNAHDLTLTGTAVSTITGPDGGPALTWAGAYGHNGTAISSNQAQTFECWVYLDTLPAAQTFLVTMGNGVNGSGGYASVYVQTDGTVVAQCWTSANHTTISPSALSLGKWHHIVATSSDLMRLYVDGVLVTTGTAMGGGWSRTFYLPGTQSVKMAYPAYYYSLALSAARITTHYQVGSDDKKPPAISFAYGQNNSGNLDVHYGLSQGFGVDVTMDITGDLTQTVDAGIGTPGVFSLSGLTLGQLYQLTLTPSNTYGTGGGYAMNAKLTNNVFDQKVEGDAPAVFFDLQESSGTTMFDRYSDPQNGTYNGGFTLNDTVQVASANTNIGQHVRLDGSSGYLQAAGGSWLTPSQGFTFEGCFYIRSLSNGMRIFDFANAPSVNDMYLAANGSGGMTLGVGATSMSFSLLPIGQWFHLMVTVSATGAASIYVNGKSYASGTVGVPTDGTRAYQYIGKSAYSTDPYLAASVSHIAMYNHVLSVFTATAHAAAAIPAMAAVNGAFYAYENIGVTLTSGRVGAADAYENIGLLLIPNRTGTADAMENVLARVAFRGWGTPMGK